MGWKRYRREDSSLSTHFYVILAFGSMLIFYTFKIKLNQQDKPKLIANSILNKWHNYTQGGKRTKTSNLNTMCWLHILNSFSRFLLSSSLNVGILKLFVVNVGLGKWISVLMRGVRVLTVEEGRHRYKTGMARKNLWDWTEIGGIEVTLWCLIYIFYKNFNVINDKGWDTFPDWRTLEEHNI